MLLESVSCLWEDGKWTSAWVESFRDTAAVVEWQTATQPHAISEILRNHRNWDIFFYCCTHSYTSMCFPTQLLLFFFRQKYKHKGNNSRCSIQRHFLFFFKQHCMSLQQYIAFLSEEFLRQAPKLGWLFTHSTCRELIDFTVCRLVEIKPLSSTS